MPLDPKRWRDLDFTPNYMPDDQPPVSPKVVVGVLAAALGFGAFAMGFMIGANDVNSNLVQCEEDEVWYPADFTHHETVADLKCIHIEVLQADD
jgi:hypothetical protein